MSNRVMLSHSQARGLPPLGVQGGPAPEKCHDPLGSSKEEGQGRKGGHGVPPAHHSRLFSNIKDLGGGVLWSWCPHFLELTRRSRVGPDAGAPSHPHLLWGPPHCYSNLEEAWIPTHQFPTWSHCTSRVFYPEQSDPPNTPPEDERGR